MSTIRALIAEAREHHNAADDCLREAKDHARHGGSVVAVPALIALGRAQQMCLDEVLSALGRFATVEAQLDARLFGPDASRLTDEDLITRVEILARGPGLSDEHRSRLTEALR